MRKTTTEKPYGAQLMSPHLSDLSLPDVTAPLLNGKLRTTAYPLLFQPPARIRTAPVSTPSATPTSITKAAFSDALRDLSQRKGLNTAAIQAAHLPELLLATLQGLCDFFSETPTIKKIKISDDCLLACLEHKIKKKVSAPEVLYFLQTHLSLYPFGFWNHGTIYHSMKATLALPAFQVQSLWQATTERVNHLEAIDIKNQTEIQALRDQLQNTQEELGHSNFKVVRLEKLLQTIQEENEKLRKERTGSSELEVSHNKSIKRVTKNNFPLVSGESVVITENKTLNPKVNAPENSLNRSRFSTMATIRKPAHPSDSAAAFTAGNITKTPHHDRSRTTPGASSQPHASRFAAQKGTPCLFTVTEAQESDPNNTQRSISVTPFGQY